MAVVLIKTRGVNLIQTKKYLVSVIEGINEIFSDNNVKNFM